MAFITRNKNSRSAKKRVAPAARRIELKNPVKRAALNKKLRREPARQKKNNRFVAGIWLRMRAPLGWTLGMGLGLLIFICAGVGLLYAYNFFTTSPYFAVKTIEIQGQNRLKSREVLETAGVNYGQNTLALSMNELESALSRNRWIAELSIRRVLPDGIEIKIREYEPRYWVKQGGQLVYADEYGSLIAPVSVGTFSPYPLLEVEGGAEYLAAKLPELVGSLEKMSFPVNVHNAGSIRLTASRSMEINLDSGLRLAVGLEGWDENVRNLVRVLEDLSRRGELKNAAEIKAHGYGVWVAAKRQSA